MDPFKNILEVFFPEFKSSGTKASIKAVFPEPTGPPIPTRAGPGSDA